MIPGAPVAACTTFVLFLAAAWMLWCAGGVAALAETMWPNLAENIGLVWVRRHANHLLRGRGNGLGNP